MVDLKERIAKKLATNRYVECSYHGVHIKVVPKVLNISIDPTDKYPNHKSYEILDTVHHYGCDLIAPDLDAVLLWWMDLIDYGYENDLGFLDLYNLCVDTSVYPKEVYDSIEAKYGVVLF